MKRIFFLMGLLLCTVYLVSCKKVKNGVQTRVTGYVIDTLKNKRLANAPIVIYGCRIAGEAGRSCADSVAASQSNANGEVDFTFTSNGKFIDYEASVQNDLDHYNLRYFDLNPGKENFIAFKAFETVKISFKLKILATTADNFFISSYMRKQQMAATPIDIILECKGIPNQIAVIDFQALYANKQLKGFRDIHKIGRNDTTIVKLVDNTDNLPIR
jgi:uncharacterized protein YlaI